ncbi:response regulator transcription factor [Nonlabens sp. Ci31]|jgi:DNA-binding NarL/FixJ family response regulator|uniref:response regulator n=1 Tax=Nonlabens sp. Ci31 TaxID=2608253 RepID=UPI001462FAF4|nr:response regulator transcription factor [Nonlabens sp. Ci31]QJP34360.1 response regulator transcription factor [Nonlabens sp. Ci31]
MNILIADHHPVFRRGLRSMMKDHKEFSFKAKVDDANDLIASIAFHHPDVLILEVDLPNSSGIGTLRELRSHFPDLKVLVVSYHPEEIYAISAVKAGANGYISKTRSIKEVRKSLLSIARGESYLSEEMKSQIDNKNNKDILKFKKLSTREIEVLNLLSKGRRNKEIAKALSIHEKTVSTYKTRLLKKLKVDNIADLIHQSRLLQIAS